MALIFVDSFDHYAIADIGQKWTYVNNNGMSLPASGRFSTKCVSITGSLDTFYVDVPAQATYVLGAAFWCTGWTSYHYLARFQNGATQHVYFTVSGNKIVAVRGDGTTLGTGATSLATSTFYYIEFKVTVSDTVGAVVVKLNGVTELNLTNIDTRNGAAAQIDRVQVGMGQNNGGINEMRIDDLYVCDTTGSVNNDFLGDVRVQAIYPTGNGATSGMTGSDGNSVNNYLLVQEVTPNTTDYVESSVVGTKDTYAYGDVTPTTGTVMGVQVLAWAQKTDAGARSIASVARLAAGTEADSANQTLNSTYGYARDVRETKPGGGAWAIADVNGAEFGVKVTA